MVGRMEINSEVDRLSVMPDELLFKILSFVGLKDAIATSFLSSKWKYVWTSIPHLSFSSEDFSTMGKFYDFVTRVLSLRNNQAQLFSFKLYLRGKEDGQDVAQRILNQAFSLNVPQVNITCLFGKNTCLRKKNTLPLSLPTSQTLKHLTFSRWGSSYDYIILNSTQEFSSLSTLHLSYITLSEEFLSMCPMLESLTLHFCNMTGSKGLGICHPRLSKLTLENGNSNAHNVYLVTPQLKNLTIQNYFGEFRVHAPELASLLFKGLCPSMFSTDGFHSLEQAQLSFHSLTAISNSSASTIIGLLQKFHNVKLLSLSMEIIQVYLLYVHLTKIFYSSNQ
ncbi:putative F-box domain, leucine-rich repeat domain superfamily, F-box-like domain superfamily [Helianthus anomalus]